MQEEYTELQKQTIVAIDKLIARYERGSFREIIEVFGYTGSCPLCKLHIKINNKPLSCCQNCPWVVIHNTVCDHIQSYHAFRKDITNHQDWRSAITYKLFKKACRIRKNDYTQLRKDYIQWLEKKN